MTLFLSIATILLAAVVAGVTWMQWRVADNKLRLDLFDRRYQVYEATLRFFFQSVQHSTQIDLYLSVFNEETLKAEFLFDTDVVKYLGENSSTGAETGRGCCRMA